MVIGKDVLERSNLSLASEPDDPLSHLDAQQQACIL
jgi:hypothetical protein